MLKPYTLLLSPTISTSMALKQVYEQTPGIALEFFKLSYPERTVAIKAITSDGKRAAEAAPQPDSAVEMGKKLKAMAGRVDQSMTQDYRDFLQRELMQHSVFMDYTTFRYMCTAGLASVRRKVRNAWEQAYLLFTGYAQIANEVVRQAKEAAQDRLDILANDLSNVLRETHLEDWIVEQGGWENFGSNVTGEEQVVHIDVPEEGTSVD